MYLRFQKFIGAVLFGAVVISNTLFANTLKLSDQSSIRLSGDSSLHQYHSETSSFNLTLEEVKGSLTQEALIHFILANKPVQLSIPVQTLKSDKGGLDSNMYKHLKAEVNPHIQFVLDEIEMLPNESTRNNFFNFTFEGVLSVAGVTNNITFPVQGFYEEKIFILEGVSELLMTDFNIKPPSMFFGRIKTKNPVQIHFKLIYL